jgi:hypothetical protein
MQRVLACVSITVLSLGLGACSEAPLPGSAAKAPSPNVNAAPSAAVAATSPTSTIPAASVTAVVPSESHSNGTSTLQSTTLRSTIAPSPTVSQPTSVPLVGILPSITPTPTTDAVQVGTSFIRAALDADPVTLRALTNISYADTAVTLWISGSGPTGQAIIATKPLAQSAGRARIAVFVDSTDLRIAALPFTVDLLQDPTTQLWTVIDAGLQMP